MDFADGGLGISLPEFLVFLAELSVGGILLAATMIGVARLRGRRSSPHRRRRRRRPRG